MVYYCLINWCRLSSTLVGRLSIEITERSQLAPCIVGAVDIERTWNLARCGAREEKTMETRELYGDTPPAGPPLELPETGRNVPKEMEGAQQKGSYVQLQIRKQVPCQ